MIKYALPLLLAISLSACKQGAGSRCQVTSDCDDGLVCILPPGGAIQSGGTCQVLGADDAGVDGGDDLSVPASEDLATTDSN